LNRAELTTIVSRLAIAAIWPNAGGIDGATTGPALPLRLSVRPSGMQRIDHPHTGAAPAGFDRRRKA